MRAGVDSWSYHRLLGDHRVGEQAVAAPWTDGPPGIVRAAVADGAEVISLQTSQLGPPAELDVDALLEAAGEVEIMLAWGTPEGFRYGTSRERAQEMLEWLELAPRFSSPYMRIAVAGPGVPRPEGDWMEPVSAALEPAFALAERLAIGLLLENHTDLDVAEMERLLDAFPSLGICFDTANAQRLGDDPVAAARRLRERIRSLHLKDVEPWDPDNPPWSWPTDDPSNELGRGPVSVAYGEGAVDVAGVMDELADVPVDLSVCVELGQVPSGDAHEREMIVAALEWIKARRDPGR